MAVATFIKPKAVLSAAFGFLGFIMSVVLMLHFSKFKF